MACSKEERDIRNCLNKKELTEDSIIVEEYTYTIEKEHQRKKGKKVFSLKGGVQWAKIFRLYECPLTLITADTRDLISLLGSTKDSPLIFPGTILDQPFWWVEAVEIYKKELLRDPPKDGKKG